MENMARTETTAASRVRQQRLRLGGRAVQAVAQQTGGVGVEEAQRRFHQVRHTPLADVGGRAERGQMRAHQRREVNRDAGHGKRKGHPAVTRDPRCERPARRHGDEIPRGKPDADIGRHAEDHGDCGQAQTQKGQLLIAARVAEQDSQVALFLFLHMHFSLEVRWLIGVG